MSDRYIYDVCSPKDITLPIEFEADFDGVASTCLLVLERFTERQLIEATYRFDTAIKAVVPFALDPQALTTGETYGDYACGGHNGFLRHAMRSGRSVDSDLGLEGVTWAEGFALAALAILAFAARDEQFMQRANIDIDEKFSRMGRYAIESTKLATTALMLFAEEKKTRDLDNLFKKSGKQGGQKRTDFYRPLKELVISRYLADHQHRSNREAARRIWAELSEEENTAQDGRRILTSDDPAHTIQKWIGAYKKDLASIQRDDA